MLLERRLSAWRTGLEGVLDVVVNAKTRNSQVVAPVVPDLQAETETESKAADSTTEPAPGPQVPPAAA